MHSLPMVIFALVAVISLPYLTTAETTEGTELEEPKTLPLTDAVKNTEQAKSINEFWTEDVNEVVIRKQRGAKEQSGAGKKKERKHGASTTTTTTKMPKPEIDTNLESTQSTSTTQDSKKHQHHQSKHDKINSKKHLSTIKPKTKTEKDDACRYTKSAWSECDPKTNTRSRTFTLKKGEASCVQTRNIQKKCKKSKSDKACRYDKGVLSECQPNGEMTRIDKLKTTSDSSACQPTRTITKKCNKTKQEKQAKDRNSKEKKQKDRKNRQ